MKRDGPGYIAIGFHIPRQNQQNFLPLRDSNCCQQTIMKLLLLPWCLGLARAGNIVEELTKAG